jgi:hypothetical protein
VETHAFDLALEANPFAEGLEEAGADQGGDHHNDQDNGDDEVLVGGLDLEGECEGDDSAHQS